MVQIHSWVDKTADDYQAVLRCAYFFAEAGKATKVLPKVHYKNSLYTEIYGDLIGTPYESKCPDFRVGKYFYELEGYSGDAHKRKTKKMVKRGLEQSSYIVISDAGATDRYLHSLADIHRRNGNEVNEIWVINDKRKLRLAYKSENPNN